MNNRKLLIAGLLVWVLLFLQYGIVFAQEKKVTLRMVSSNDNATIELFDVELDKIWKPAFKYAIVISPKATIKEYSKALHCLEAKGSKFNRNNTLVICKEEDKERAEEVAPGFVKYISQSIPSANGKEVFFYSIKKKKTPDLDYQLERIEPSDENM